MPSRSATRRASSASSSEQQREPLAGEVQRHADHLEALLDEQRGGDRRVDAARHRDDDALAPPRAAHAAPARTRAHEVREQREHAVDLRFVDAVADARSAASARACSACGPSRAAPATASTEPERAGGARRDRDALEVERLRAARSPAAPSNSTLSVFGSTSRSRAVAAHARAPSRAMPVPEAVAQRAPHALGALAELARRQLAGDAEARRCRRRSRCRRAARAPGAPPRSHGSRRAPPRSDQEADALRPVELVRRARRARSTPRSREVARGIFPIAWVASTCSGTPRARHARRDRARSAGARRSRCSPRGSRRARCRRAIAAATASGSTQSVARRPPRASRGDPRASSAASGSSTDGCSAVVVTTCRARAALRASAVQRAVVRLGRAGGEDDLVRLRADQRRDALARALDARRAPRRPRRARSTGCRSTSRSARAHRRRRPRRARESSRCGRGRCARDRATVRGAARARQRAAAGARPLPAAPRGVRFARRAAATSSSISTTPRARSRGRGAPPGALAAAAQRLEHVDDTHAVRRATELVDAAPPGVAPREHAMPRLLELREDVAHRAQRARRACSESASSSEGRSPSRKRRATASATASPIASRAAGPRASPRTSRR